MLMSRDIETRHGDPSHAPHWAKDQALVAPLDSLAQQCEYPWAPQFAPATCEPAPLAATQGPPVAAQGHPISAPLVHAPVQDSLAGTPIAVVQVPSATAQTSAIAASAAPQAPGAAQVTPVAAQVHPAAAQIPAVVAPAAQVQAGVASPTAQFPPPTDYFGHAMDDSERRYAGKTREDIEKQYKEGMWLLRNEFPSLLAMLIFLSQSKNSTTSEYCSTSMRSRLPSTTLGMWRRP